MAGFKNDANSSKVNNVYGSGTTKMKTPESKIYQNKNLNIINSNDINNKNIESSDVSEFDFSDLFDAIGEGFSNFCGDLSGEYKGLKIGDIGYSSEDVLGYEFSMDNGRGCAIIHFKDGYDAWYDMETKKITRLINNSKELSIYFDYDISDEERKKIEDLYIGENKLDSNESIDYIANLVIKGKVITFNAIDEGDKVLSKVKKYSDLVCDKYSTLMLSDLDESFSGFVFSSWENSPDPDKKFKASAFQWGSQDVGYYIFFPTGDFSSDFTQWLFGEDALFFHEMGHVFESICQDKDALDMNNWNSLYDKYKDKIVWLKGNSGYVPPLNWYSPNEKEFFAESTAIYYNHPEELIINMPEVFEILNNYYNYYSNDPI